MCLKYNIHYFCNSHIGKCRTINQDNFICDGAYWNTEDDQLRLPLRGTIDNSYHPLFGVFDGMGGEEQGEVAALIAAKCASQLYIGNQSSVDLVEFCKQANQKICEYATKNNIVSMGTTAALLLFSEKDIFLCNIGDSKIFRYSSEELEQISFDHYAVTVHGLKPPLSQNLGIPAEEMIIDPYVAKGKYNGGDIYLICSDGLTDMVSNEIILEVFEKYEFELAANKLLDLALENGGKDNITFILCKIERKPITLISKIFRNAKRD